MDIGSILLILGLFLLVVLFISQPIMQRSATVVSEEEHQYSHLLAERDRILNALQELDFDYSLGKIPEESYPAQRAVFLKNGAAILRQIDEYQGVTASSGSEEAAIDTRLEAEIASRRADAGFAEQIPLDDEELENLIANRRRERKEKSGGFCPQCGNSVQVSDRFCPKCGEKI